MKQTTSNKAVELGDQLHIVQRRIRDLEKELAELKGQESVFTQRLVNEVGGDDTVFPSSDGYMKVVEIFHEPDPDDYDVPAMIAVFAKLKRRVPLTKRVRALILYQLNSEV
jgi:hypothetical protein